VSASEPVGGGESFFRRSSSSVKSPFWPVPLRRSKPLRRSHPERRSAWVMGICRTRRSNIFLRPPKSAITFDKLDAWEGASACFLARSPFSRDRFILPMGGALSHMLQEDAQHAAQGFCRPPEQLITHRESGQVVRPHDQLTHAAHGDGQRTGYLRGG